MTILTLTTAIIYYLNRIKFVFISVSFFLFVSTVMIILSPAAASALFYSLYFWSINV